MLEAYTPYIIATIGALLSMGVCVYVTQDQVKDCATKTDLETAKAETLKEVDNKYATQQHVQDTVCTLSNQLNAILGKTDEMSNDIKAMQKDQLKFQKEIYELVYKRRQADKE